MARSVSYVSAAKLVSMTRGNHRLAVIDVRDEERSYQAHIAGSHHFASGSFAARLRSRGPPAERTPSSSTARSARTSIRDRVGVAPIAEKLVQHRLRWFGHIQRRPPDAPVHSGRLKRAENVKRGRDRPNLTWEESVKRDLKDWSITKELAMDSAAWKLAIHVPEP